MIDKKIAVIIVRDNRMDRCWRNYKKKERKTSLENTNVCLSKFWIHFNAVF